MRIGIFSQWYDPEPGPAATTGVMARALVDRGHEVHVLTGFPNYPSGRFIEGYRPSWRMRETVEGVKITRVPLYPSHDGSSLKRIANYASFGIAAAVMGVPSLPKLDALWVNYSPITLAAPMWLQQIMHRTPTVCEVADLWPDTLAVAGLKGSGLIRRVASRFLSKWCEAMYSTSAAVVHISPGAGQVLQERGVPADKLHYIPKAADEELFHGRGQSMRAELGIPEDTVVLLYAGSLGTAQGIHTLVDACAMVGEGKLTVLIAGSGTREAELRSQASSSGLSFVRFLGRVSPERVPDLLATSDIAYVSLASHATSRIVMPSKTQNVLASGRPVLAVADGDLADMVDNQGLGFTARSGTVEEIAAAIRMALNASRAGLADLGRKARHFYESEFSVSRLGLQTEQLLKEVSKRRRPSFASRSAGESQ